MTDELLKALDTRYVSLHRVEAFFKTMKKDIGEILVSPDQLAQRIVNCQEYLLTKVDYQEQLLSNPKKLSKELQYNSWIFEDIKSKLRCSGFAVQPEYPNKNIIPPVNKYSTSFTDCAIFHPQTTSTTITLLNVSIDEGNSESDLDIGESELPTNAPPLHDVLSHAVDRAGTAECFSNMIGVGTRIATDIF